MGAGLLRGSFALEYIAAQTRSGVRAMSESQHESHLQLAVTWAEGLGLPGKLQG
jgi:hypothetical protein